MRVSETILDLIPERGVIQKQRLKWLVAEALSIASAASISGLSPPQALTRSFQSSFGRALTRLASQGRVLRERGNIMSLVDDLPEVYADSANDSVTRHARWQVLPALLAAKPGELMFGRTETPGNVRDQMSRLMKWMSAGFEKPDMLRPPEVRRALPVLSDLANQITDTFFDGKIAGRLRSVLKSASVRRRFLADMTVIASWSVGGYGGSKDLYSATMNALTVFESAQATDTASYGALSEMKRILARVHELAWGTLALKDRISLFAETKTRSVVGLCDTALVYLEERHPQLCSAFARYTKLGSWQRKVATSKWPRFGLPSIKPTLPNDHPFRHLIGQDIFRSAETVSLVS